MPTSSRRPQQFLTICNLSTSILELWLRMQRWMGGEKLRRLILMGLAPAAVILAISGAERAIRPVQAAWLCPKKTDYVSGFNRICVYRCPTGDVAVTIGATELCPISIQN